MSFDHFIKMNKRLKYIAIVALVFFSCKSDDQTAISDSSLASLVAKNNIQTDNVIACASGSMTDENTIIAYLYPRPQATDIRYFETSSIKDDKNDYQKYKQIAIEATNFFNGYLKKFTHTVTEEKWVIITFFEDNVLHLSNPIRLKHLSKPTEFTSNVMVNNQNQGMPTFIWDDGIYDDNKIYFQVISEVNDNFLSGTYTFEKQFQYYKLNNVVLNITQDIPPQLNPENSYNFTLMGVSEDNWVNLFIEKKFIP